MINLDIQVHCFRCLRHQLLIFWNYYLNHCQSKKTKGQRILSRDLSCSRTVIAFITIYKLFRNTFRFTARVKMPEKKKFLMRYLVSQFRTILAFMAFITLYELYWIPVEFTASVRSRTCKNITNLQPQYMHGILSWTLSFFNAKILFTGCWET